MIFQNSLYNDFFYAFIVLISVFVISKSLLFVLHKIIKKTKIIAVERIYTSIKNPVFLMIVSFGVYLGIKILSSLKDYSSIISKVFVIWFTFLFAFIIVRFLRSSAEGYFTKFKQDGTRKSKLDKTAINFIENTLSIIVYVVMGLILLGFFNVKITPLLATLGIAGLAVALALQDTLSNLFASIYLVKERPVNIGDYIKLENGEEGYVESISWRNSTIKTLPDNRVVIPNSTLSKMIITNYNYPTKNMAVVLQCGVAYGSDLKKVEKVTIDTAKKTLKSVPGGCKDFEPFIRYHTFGDSNIQFSIILRVNEYVDKYLVTHEFIKNLTEDYRRNKIEISWPVRKIYYEKDKG